MTLVDTSAWIELLNGSLGSRVPEANANQAQDMLN